MTIRARVAGSIGLLFLLAIARTSVAADQEATLQQMTSLNKGAIAAYSAGDFDKCKTQLLQAVALGNKNSELQNHPLMARTYLHLGVLHVDGFEDRPTGVQYFVKALKIRPDIELTQALATASAKSAFDEAKGAAKGGPAAAVAAGPGGKDAATKQPVAKDKEPSGKGSPAAAKENATNQAAAPANDKAEEKPAPKLTATEKRKAAEAAQRAAAEDKKKAAAEEKRAAAEARLAAIEEKKAAAEEKKKAAADARQAAIDKKKAAAEEKKKAAETAKHPAALAKQAAAPAKQTPEAAKQGTEPAKQAAVDDKGAAKEKLQSEKADKEKQVADTKAAVDQIQKDAKEKEKQAQAERDKLTKELAQLKDSEAKERTAKEKLQAEKADKEKQLAEAKAALQQLQKEKAEQEKQLAESGAREKKEREAKEKLDKERLLAETREKEHQTQLEGERQERERRAAGPDLPAHIPEPLYCAVPDEAQSGIELFVHCAPRSDVKAKVIALYYRQSGAVHYNSLSMEPAKKGWHMAVIPADKVTGKVLQYYVEALDARGGLVAATGKATSPNILTLRSTPVVPPKAGAVSPSLAKAVGRAAPRKSH